MGFYFPFFLLTIDIKMISFRARCNGRYWHERENNELRGKGAARPERLGGAVPDDNSVPGGDRFAYILRSKHWRVQLFRQLMVMQNQEHHLLFLWGLMIYIIKIIILTENFIMYKLLLLFCNKANYNYNKLLLKFELFFPQRQ